MNTSSEEPGHGATQTSGRGPSPSPRFEIAADYADAYAASSKKVKGQILDQVVSRTGWSRDNARRRLGKAARSAEGNRPTSGKSDRRRPEKFSPEAKAALQRVWAISGGQYGRYLSVSMPLLLDLLEARGTFVYGQDGYSKSVREELLLMSVASINRYLRQARVQGVFLDGVPVERASPLLRTSRRARDSCCQVEPEPGRLVGEVIAHCGSSLHGGYVSTLNLTCAHTGWVRTVTIPYDAVVHILPALDTALDTLPIETVALDLDWDEDPVGGLSDWAGRRNILLGWPAGAHSEKKPRKNHFVSRYALSYRYDTAEGASTLNRLWPLVNDRLNYLTPTTKIIGHYLDGNGQPAHRYDAPATPCDRLLTSGTLSPSQQVEMLARRDNLDPDAMRQQIAELQAELAHLAETRANRVTDASPADLPDVHLGVRTKN